ncbi:hypothetical protein PDJAM_G00171600 [Pangasius djambal]|uniref:Uncharacterized protein n=1 Tax=Pangasius djambal TaxID=1691987 RepID=A0ACC5ZMD1_9TELE|nr:hypothetical protein [Pangasius djambal]
MTRRRRFLYPNTLTGSTFGFFYCSTSFFFSSCTLLFHKRLQKSGCYGRTGDCGSPAEEMTAFRLLGPASVASADLLLFTCHQKAESAPPCPRRVQRTAALKHRTNIPLQSLMPPPEH